MAKLTTRSLTTTAVTSNNIPKGSALTHSELDSNFLNLETDKLENTTDDFTGTLSIKGSGGAAVGQIDFYDNDDSNKLTVKAPATITADYTLTLPDTDGDSGQVLTTDGSGVLTWTSKTVDTTNLVDDTTPQLGGDLDVNGNKIITTSDADMVIKPDQTSATGFYGPQGEYGWNGGVAHFNTALSVKQGTDTADHSLLYNAGIQVTATHDSYPALVLKSQSDSNKFGNVWFAKSGADASDAYCASGDVIGGFYFSPYDEQAGNYFKTPGKFLAKASQAHANGALGTHLEWYATPDDSTTMVKVVDMRGEEVIINPDSADVDFRVHGDTNSDVFKVDAGNETVSIGGSGKITTASNGDLAIEPNGTGKTDIGVATAAGYSGARPEGAVRIYNRGGLTVGGADYADTSFFVRDGTDPNNYCLEVQHDAGSTGLTTGGAAGSFGFGGYADSGNGAGSSTYCYTGAITSTLGQDLTASSSTLDNKHKIRLNVFPNGIGYGDAANGEPHGFQSVPIADFERNALNLFDFRFSIENSISENTLTNDVSASASSTTLTSAGSNFTADMVGKKIRISNAIATPGAFYNNNDLLTTVASFTSTSSIEVTDTITQAISGVTAIVYTENIILRPKANAGGSLTLKSQDGTSQVKINEDGYFVWTGLPTSATGLPTGAMYNDAGTLKIA